jgi:hypothetical protein
MSFNRKLLNQMIEESKRDNSLPKYKVEGWLDNYAKKPIVNSNGYIDGEPPSGHNWRIPGNEITMDLPGMPSKILAVPSEGNSKVVNKGEKASFPKAKYVDEYSLPKAQNGLNFLRKEDPEMSFEHLYNTSLTKEETNKFNKWVKEESSKQGRNILMDKGAYDVQGFWKSGDWKRRDSDGHGTDTWKKPNHPTFSNQSKYHGINGFYGGNWTKDGGYQPSKQTMSLYDENYYKWMFGSEPNRREHLDLSRYKSGVNKSSILYYKNGGDISIPNLEEDGWLDRYINKKLEGYQSGGQYPSSNSKEKGMQDDRRYFAKGADQNISRNYPVNESLETGTKDSKDFLKNWYTERAKDPYFTDVAKKRLEEFDKVKVVTENSNPEGDSLFKSGVAGYYDPTSKEVRINPNNPYSRGTLTQIHEIGHHLYDQVPQSGQEEIILNNITDKDTFDKSDPYGRPSEYQHDYTKTPEENKKAKEQFDSFGYEYHSTPTEVASRLLEFRKRYNIDPNHNYTPEEMQSIIDAHTNRRSMYLPEVPYKDTSDEDAQSGDTSIDELLMIIGNDPTKLSNLNNEIVYQQPSQQKLTTAKFGGWLDRYDKGGSTTTETTRPPIYVDNPNDPRLKAYNDSLDLYNNFNVLKKSLESQNYVPGKNRNESIYKWLNDTSRASQNRIPRDDKKERDGIYSTSDFIRGVVNKTLPRQLYSYNIKPQGTINYEHKDPSLLGSIIESINPKHPERKNDRRLIADYSNVKPVQPVVYKKPNNKIVDKLTRTEKFIPKPKPKEQIQPQLKMVGNERRDIAPSFNTRIPSPNIPSIARPDNKYMVSYTDEEGVGREEYFPTPELADQYMNWRRDNDMFYGTGMSRRGVFQGGGSLPKFQNRGEVPYWMKRPSDISQTVKSNAQIQREIEGTKRLAQQREQEARTRTTIGADTRTAKQKQQDAEFTQQVNKRRKDLGFIEGSGHSQETIDRNRKQADRIIHNLVDVPATIVGASELAYGLGKGVAKVAPRVGEYLTTQTPLKNAYKYNPWAFKPNPEAYYHRSPNLENVIIDNKLVGFGATPKGKILNDEAIKKYGRDVINLKKAANYEPYFSKGTPLDWGRYNKPNTNLAGKAGQMAQGYPGPYLAEATNIPFVAKADGKLAKVWNSDGSFKRGIAPNEIGSYATPVEGNVPLENLKFYKEDWLRGYKQVKPTSVSSSVENVGNKFKSEIDWRNWVKYKEDFDNNPQIIQELVDIERTSKANRTWMKNPDGSAFQGTPEQFVIQQSSNFKKAFPNPILDKNNNIQINYHGSPSELKDNQFIEYHNPNNEIGTGISTTIHKNYAKGFSEMRNPMYGQPKKPTVYELYQNSYNPQPYPEHLIGTDEYVKMFDRGDFSLKKGFDSFTKGHQTIVPFTNYPKSAIGNILFDMTNPNIYKSIVPYTIPAAIGAGALQQKKQGGQINWLNKYE